MQVSRIYFFVLSGTATTEIYTLSLHDALPIWEVVLAEQFAHLELDQVEQLGIVDEIALIEEDDDLRHVHLAREHILLARRSEEHTSELQSLTNLVCRLLLEKKNTPTCGESSVT